MSDRSMALDVIVRLRDRLSPGLGRITSGLGRLTAVAKRLAAISFAGLAAFVAGTGAFARGIISTGMQAEKSLAILETIEGSSERARRSLEWVQGFAKTTPYELDQVRDAFVKLKSYGLEPMDGLLENTGNMAAAMGKDLNDAVEAIADAVTGENERLKEFGIRASKAGDQITYTFSKNGKEMKLVARNTTADILRVLEEIMAVRFAGAMEKQAGTLEGILSNISDQWTAFKQRVADAGFYDYVKSRLEEFLGLINRMAEDGSLQRLAQTISDRLVDALKLLERWGRRAFEWAQRFDWAGLWSDMRELGRAIAAIIRFFGNLADTASRLGSADFGSLGSGVRDLAGSFGGGNAALLAAGAVALGTLGLRLGRFLLGGRGLQLVAIAAGLSALAGAGGEMSVVDWVMIGAGLAAVAGPLARIAASLLGINRNRGALAAVQNLPTGAAPAGGATKGGKSNPTGGRQPTGVGGWGWLAFALSGANILGDVAKLDTAQAWNERMRQNRERDARMNAWLEGYIGSPKGWGEAMKRWAGWSANAAPPPVVTTPKTGRPLPAPDPARFGRGPDPARFGGDLPSFEPLRSSLDALTSMLARTGRADAIRLPEQAPVPKPRPDVVGPVRQEGEEARSEAERIGQRIEEAFSVTARPVVDTSSIDAAAAKVERLSRALRNLPGAAVSTGGAGGKTGRLPAVGNNGRMIGRV